MDANTINVCVVFVNSLKKLFVPSLSFLHEIMEEIILLLHRIKIHSQVMVSIFRSIKRRGSARLPAGSTHLQT